mgnify:CR=1 FL=1
MVFHTVVKCRIWSLIALFQHNLIEITKYYLPVHNNCSTINMKDDKNT